MKKTTKLLLSTLLSVSLLSGCTTATPEPTTVAPETTTVAETTSLAETEATVAETTAEETSVAETTEQVDVRIVALKGPTAMGMVQMMDGVENGSINDNEYTFDMVTDVSTIAPMIAKEEVDMAAVPANLASVLYNNTDGAVQVTNINTLGVLYIVENGNTIISIDDLRGKTIYASGKGATPEYALRYILSENGIDPDADVTIEWKSEHAECLAAVTAEANAIAMLPQPFVTSGLMNAEGVNVVLDLNKEWDSIQEDEENPSALTTGVLVVRTEFAEENPEAVEAFLNHYEASVSYVNENLEDGAALVGKYEIVPEAVALKAIPACNITYIADADMKETLNGYLTVLFEQNPASIGGTLPDDAFYYGN